MAGAGGGSTDRGSQASERAGVQGCYGVDVDAQRSLFDGVASALRSGLADFHGLFTKLISRCAWDVGAGHVDAGWFPHSKWFLFVNHRVVSRLILGIMCWYIFRGRAWGWETITLAIGLKNYT